MPEYRYPKKLFSKDWNIKPHRGRQRKVWSRIINDLFVSLELECVLCGNECESVSHVLWECSAYGNSRADFLLKLQEKLGNGFERFDGLDSLGKSSFILGSELWEEHFDSLLLLVKDYVVDIWEAW